MTRVMVVVASRHGATRGIAERLADVLRTDGLEVALFDADEAPHPNGFDALVVGGAAYMGKWLEPVAAYVRRHRAPIGGRPTWLFSSGPVGTETVDKNGQDVLAPPPFLRDAAEEVGARGSRSSSGAGTRTTRRRTSPSGSSASFRCPASSCPSGTSATGRPSRPGATRSRASSGRRRRTEVRRSRSPCARGQ